MQKRRLTDKSLKSIEAGKILFVLLSDTGAMGTPGNTAIYVNENGRPVCYEGNYAKGGFDLMSLTQKFPVHVNFMTQGESEGWQMIYAGAGNMIYLRSELYNAFSRFTRSKNESELYAMVPEYIALLFDLPRKKVGIHIIYSGQDPNSRRRSWGLFANIMQR